MPQPISCSSCGNAIADGVRFCPACGTEVGDPTTAPTVQLARAEPGPTQCGRCTAPMGRDDRFCPKCGSARPEAATVVLDVSLRNTQAQHLIDATRGEFEILRQLGSGAMGAVYLAQDVALGREVAIKVIATNLLSDETMISRFQQEARTVASLRHPNIVNVHAVRQLDDLHFFVMEFIDGPTLRSLIKTYAPLELDVFRGIMFQVGSALSYAHRKGGGVVHRDIKPANIMLDREGGAFVTDFGISKLTEGNSGLTRTGATIGTPEYMSPEQCRGEELYGASDQYALGIVGYEMLCGRTPFSGSQYTVMVAHTSERPTPVGELRPDCPPDVAEALLRMLAKEPKDRWPDLDAAVKALGGQPLGYKDPVRDKIVRLSEAVLSGQEIPTGERPVTGGGGSTGTATSISVTGIPSLVETGDTFSLGAEVKGEENASLSGVAVVWASTDPSIASVRDGVVEALKPGSVSITATSGQVASSVLLTVADPVPAEIAVTPAVVTIQRGGRIGLSAQVLDRKHRTMDRPVAWTSEDPGVATVTQEGVVVAEGGGTVTITAECEGVSGTARVEVQGEAATASLAGAPSDATPAGDGDERAVEARRTPPRPRYGADTESVPLWKRPAAAAAVVALVAVGTGVTLMSGGGQDAGSVPATVAAPSGSDRAAGDDTPSGGEGATGGSDVASSETPAGGAPDPGAGASDVGQEVAAGGAPGGDDPGAGAGGGSPAAVGEDAPPGARAVTAVRLVLSDDGSAVGSALRVVYNQATPLRAEGLDGAGELLSGRATWRSSNTSVVSVSSAGVLTGRGRGSATISAAVGPVEESVRVTVTVPPREVRILNQVSGNAVTQMNLRPGRPAALAAQVIGMDGQPLGEAVSWRSADTNVAAIDPSGRLTGVGGGTTMIEAEVGGVVGRLPVTVLGPAGGGQAGAGQAAAASVASVVSVTPFATLVVDGNRVGEGQRRYEVRLAPGPHSIRLVRDGFAPVDTTVVIEAGVTPDPLRVQLRRAP